MIQEADLPPGRGEHRHGRGRDRRVPRRARRTSTRSRSPARPRSARSSGGRSPGPGKRAHARARRQGREHRVRGRAARPGRRGRRSTASSSTRATCAARARGCSCRSRSFEPLLEKLKDRLQTLRVGDPLDKNTDIGAINSKAQLEKIDELVAAGVDEGAEMYQPRVRPARTRASGSARRCSRTSSQSHRIAREEIFGPVLSVLTFRTPDEAVEKANNTPYGLSAGDLDREGLADPVDGRAAEGRRRLGEHVQPVRPGVAVRRLQGERASGARAACTGSSRYLELDGVTDRRRRVPVRRTAQALHRRRVPAQRVGPLVRGRSRTTAGCSRAPRAPRARTCATRSGPRAPRQPDWAGKTAYNRGQILYRVAELMEGRRDAVRGRARPTRARRTRARASTPRSTAGSGTRAGPTRSASSSARPTRSPARTSTSRSPSRPASSGSSRPATRSLLGLVSRLAPADRRRATRPSCSRASRRRCPRSRSARCSRPRTSPAASSTSSPG